MPVTSLLTTLENMETSPTIVSNNTRYGSGQAGSANTDVFIEGLQSVGRRCDNVADKGVGVSFTAADLSGAGEHVKFWVSCLQWSAVTAFDVILASGSAASAGDIHNVPANQIPDLGGFIPVWVEVARVADEGGPATETAINEAGYRITIGDVGGNAQNCILDAVNHGTSGYLWDGVTGSFDDFATFEETNREGVFLNIQGIGYCYARLEIGDATATTFTDSSFTVVFPDQPLIASDFMGVSIDLQNASTDIDLNDGTIQSSDPAAATNRPDFIVTGTSGAFDTNGLTLLGMRLVQLTSVCVLDGGALDALELTQAGAEIKNGVIRPRSASQVAMIDDPTFGSTSGIHDVDVIQQGSGHAFEISGNVDLTNINFSGFGGTPGTNSTPNSGANDAAIFNDTGGAVTITVSGGNSPSIRNGVGATTTVVNALNYTITGLDQNAVVTIVDLDNNNALLFEETAGVDNTVTYAFDGALTGKNIGVFARNTTIRNQEFDDVLPAQNTSFPITQAADTVYI